MTSSNIYPVFAKKGSEVTPPGPSAGAPLAHWKFDTFGSANDRLLDSAVAATHQLFNLFPASQTTQGAFTADAGDTALTFNDFSSSGPRTLTNTSFDFTNDQPYTVIVSVNAEFGTNATLKTVMGLFNSGSITSNWKLTYRESTEEYTIDDDSNFTTLGFTTTTGRWYRLAFVVTGTELKVYVDGYNISTAPIASQSPGYSTSNRMYFGRTGSTSGSQVSNNFVGKLDEVKIYLEALNDADVLAEFEALYGPTPLPIAYWKFDSRGENPLLDSSVSAIDHPLTIQNGGVITYVDGEVGTNTGFVPTDLVVNENFNAGQSVDWDLPQGEFTVILSAKVMTQAASGSITQKLLDVRQSSGNLLWYIGYNQNTHSFEFEGSTNFDTISNGNATPDDDVWYRIAFVNDIFDGRHKVYVDGNIIADVNNAHNIPVGNGTETLYIGGQSQSSLVTKFHGAIDNVKIYHGSLSHVEVLKEYNEIQADGAGSGPAGPDLGPSSGIAADPVLGLYSGATITAIGFSGFTEPYDLGTTRTTDQQATRVGTEPYHVETFNQSTPFAMNYGACSAFTQVVISQGEKKYVEFTTSQNVANSIGSVLTNMPVFGWWVNGRENPGVFPGESYYGRGITNLAKYANGIALATAALKIGKDDIVSMAFDFNQVLLTVLIVTVYINGFEITTITVPGHVLGDKIRPALSMTHAVDGFTAKILTHQGVQTYAPPAGFTPLEV